MTGFQRLCIITCLVIFGLVVIGGVVRATDSGLGCPDWPTCHGRLIPGWEKHTMIEYTHRLVASIAGFLVLGIAVWAWRSYRKVPAIFYPSLAVLFLIIIQAGLGGAAVLNELPPEIVAVHLGMAMTILTILGVITFTALSLTRRMPAPLVSAKLGRVALSAAAGTLILMLVGSYMSGAGYELACSGWPLCNNQIVPTEGGASVHVHYLHRVLALLVGVNLVYLLALAWRERANASLIFNLSAAAVMVFIVQSLIGAANIWTQVAATASAAHLAFATVLWIIVAVLNIRVHRWHERLPRSLGESSGRDFAPGVTR
jgi:heme A synthase